MRRMALEGLRFFAENVYHFGEDWYNLLLTDNFKDAVVLVKRIRFWLEKLFVKL